MLQETASLFDGGRRATLYVLFEESTGVLVELLRPSGGLLRSERFSPSYCPRVALERGKTDAEQVGSLGFGDPTLESGDYLLAEVFGVGFHPHMFSSGSRFLINAVERARCSPQYSSDPIFIPGLLISSFR